VRETVKAAITRRSSPTTMVGIPNRIGRPSFLTLSWVNGRLPLALRPTRYTRYIRGGITKKPIPTQMRTAKANAHGGDVEKRNLRHVSEGAPVIAQTGGNSPLASCEAQTVTRSWRLTNHDARRLVVAG
jgi:hypothetical protein